MTSLGVNLREKSIVHIFELWKNFPDPKSYISSGGGGRFTSPPSPTHQGKFGTHPSDIFWSVPPPILG